LCYTFAKVIDDKCIAQLTAMTNHGKKKALTKNKKSDKYGGKR